MGHKDWHAGGHCRPAVASGGMHVFNAMVGMFDSIIVIVFDFIVLDVCCLIC